jgi:gluconolactonase
LFFFAAYFMYAIETNKLDGFIERLAGIAGPLCQRSLALISVSLFTRIRWMAGSIISTIIIVMMLFSITWQSAKAAVLTDLVAPGATLQTIATGFGFVEGPVWHRDGYLLFSDQTRNQIMKWHPTSGLTTYRSNITGTNGLTFDAQNRLLIAQQAGRQLTREETPGGTLTTLAITFGGKRLNSPNDVVTVADGSIYFTDPPYGTPANDKQLTFNGIFRLTTSGTLTTVATDFDHPNGLAFSPNEKILYVADTPLSQIRAFDVLADGSLANSRVFASTVSAGPDGMKVDVNGNLWVAGPGGVWVFDPAGQKIGVISVPETPANIAFGGGDLKTLYITARTGLYSIRLQVAGMAHYGLRNSGTPTSTATGPTRTPTLTNTPVPNTNLALNKTATSSSNETTAFTPNLAVDGNTTTRWASAFSDPQWLQVDLGATMNINRVVLRWEAAYANAYQIQTSNDGTNWTTIYSRTSGAGGVNDLTGLSGSGRYVRMYGTARATAFGYSLYEFEVYGGSFGPTSTPTKTATTGLTATLTRTVTLGPTVTRTQTPTPTSGASRTATLTPTTGGISTTAWYTVINKTSNKCVNMANAGTVNDTKIQDWTCNNSNAQQFQFQITSGSNYRVNNRNNSAQVWDVTGPSTADGALVHSWTYGGGTNQQWQAVSEGNGFYHFVNLNSGKCLDLTGGSTADGVQFQQWTCSGGPNQSFSLQQHP